MINVYDFDKTIYDGDSTVDFYLYCLKRKKSLICFLPIQIMGMILYILGIKEKEYFKEKFFSFLKKVPNVDLYVKEFWKEKDKNIKSWYLDQKEKTDIIISASPEFLLKPMKQKLKIDKIIASKVDKKTGKFLSKNCHDTEKVTRFNEEVKNKKIAKFYSDSMSDKPMMDLAEDAYLVKKNEVQRVETEVKNEKEKPINKLKIISANTFYLFMTVIFIYLLFNVIFNNKRSIAQVKPHILLISTILYIAFATVCYLLLKKYVKKEKKFRICLSIMFVIIQLIFAYFFVVEPSWDFGSVYTSSILDVNDILKLNENFYFYRYGNNFGIALLLKFYYSLFTALGITNYLTLGIILNIICIDVAIIYLHKTLKLIMHKEEINLFFLLTLLFTPLITYVPIFYTDTISMPFGIMGLYYFLKYDYAEQKKYLPLILSGLFLGIGSCLKFTIIIIFVAIIIYLVFKPTRTKLKYIIKTIILLGIFIFIPIVVSNIYQQSTFDSNKLNNESFPVTHWFMMGLNKNTGSFNNDDVSYTAGFTNKDKKKSANIKEFKRRIKAYQKDNKLLSFYTEKAVFVWGDGTFFAPEKLRRMPKKELEVKDYILKSPKNNFYQVLCQTQLVLMLLFIILGMIFKKYLSLNQQRLLLIVNIIIFGVFIFFLLWEARSRYIVNFIPILLISCYLGAIAVKNFIIKKRVIEINEN